MEHLRRLQRQLSVRIVTISARIERLFARAGEWWQWHWTRIAEEHGYAEALTAVLLEAVALLTRSMRVRYAAHELLAVYVAILWTLRHRGPGHEPA